LNGPLTLSLVGLVLLPTFVLAEETAPEASPSVRESITFILGEDTKQTKRFYEISEQYYRYDSTDRTDRMVTSLRSLSEVRDYLENNPPKNGQPWGLVNIVVHSNQWAGMNAPVLPHGQRTTTQTLSAALDQGEFQALPDSLMDSASEIRLQGCALGKDIALLKLLSAAFGGQDQQYPTVRSSKLFSYFQADNAQDSGYIHGLADSWFLFLKPGTSPSYEELAARFRALYPRVKLDWGDALTRQSPRVMGDVFSYKMRIPLRWTVVYPEQAEIPKLKTLKQKMAWLKSQKELRSYLKNIGLSLEHFYWQVDLGHYQVGDGKDLQAVVARGKCRVVSVIQALTQPDPSNPKVLVPMKPALDNPKFYGIGK
jgi:hypothetical protein